MKVFPEIHIAIKDVARKILPRQVVCGLRAAKILLRDHGQTKRNAIGICTDSGGNPIPWMTYPVIAFFESYDLSLCEVFEFGSGASTFFWARHCKHVISIEHCSSWYERMRDYQNDKMVILPQFDLSKYPEEINKYGLFDLIIIDGAERFASVKEGLKHIKTNGMIVVDNADWYPNCCKLIRDNGYSQYDFCGFTPLNSFTSMTSVFTKGEIPFSYKEKQNNWVPIGGKPLSSAPYDDAYN